MSSQYSGTLSDGDILQTITNARWQTLIADNILWELAHAPSLGHPAQLSGREKAVRARQKEWRAPQTSAAPPQTGYPVAEKTFNPAAPRRPILLLRDGSTLRIDAAEVSAQARVASPAVSAGLPPASSDRPFSSAHSFSYGERR